MRDKKISILLSVSFLLLLASFLILCTWVYNYYTEDKVLVKGPEKSNTPASEVTRDSLLKIYTSAIKELETGLGNTYTNADSAETRLSMKLDEFYRLKDELAILLKKPSSDDDFRLAKQKITELQNKITAMRYASTDIERENARLTKLLAEINDQKGQSAEQKPVAQLTGLKNTDPASAPLFAASDLNLSALTAEENEEADAFSVNKKIVGSFAVKNTLDLNNNEVIVVITQPNGQVLQKSSWESGAFYSRDGRKIYSCKMSFAYSKGEVKRFTFSINPDKFLKGTYTMMLYHNGAVVGKLSRVLS